MNVDDREALRSRVVAKIPAWYSPWIHLLLPAVLGVGVVVASILLVEKLIWWELLIVPATFLMSNASEWRIHKGILHRRVRGLTVLYDRHTPLHHMIFQMEDMAVKSRVEWRLVLIPAYGIMLVIAINVPLAAGMVALGLRNVGLLYLATAVGYVLSYEWLHLAYHLPRESFIGRLGIVAAMRRHHATHHHPPLMQKWNFNVTFPIWDWVRGTIYRGSMGSDGAAESGSESPREAGAAPSRR
jgi:sterol desaturase/sphingolipid hydroxylase (fatty acid hydroxylase superfamily)